jgi:hypothetical protein
VNTRQRSQYATDAGRVRSDQTHTNRLMRATSSLPERDRPRAEQDDLLAAAYPGGSSVMRAESVWSNRADRAHDSMMGDELQREPGLARTR